MMMVLMAALTAASGTKVSLDDQYYYQLAQEAAESGAVIAQDCMQKNDFISPWGTSSSLMSGENCSGVKDPLLGIEDATISTPEMDTHWEVAAMPADINEQFITSTGYVELKRKSSGTVWKTYTRQVRVKVSSEVGATKVAFGYGSNGSGSFGVFFGAITGAGDVRTLGANTYGQLGNGSTTPAISSQKFQLPNGVTAQNLYASFLSTGRSLHAVTPDGKLYAAGYNSDGQLGLGHNNLATTPELVSTNIASEQVVEVDNNSYSTYVVTKSGKVFASGLCSQGTLGTGDPCPNSNVFQQVALPIGVFVEDVVTDARTVVARTDDGRLYGWGTNTAGALGPTPTPGATAHINTPIQLASLFFRDAVGSRAKKIAFDGLTLYVIRDDGSLWAMGDNDLQQINSTATAMYTTPTQVNTVSGCDGNVKDVRTDRSHIVVLFTDGHVCTGGYNGTSTTQRGWLGRNSTASELPLGRVTGTTIYGLPSAVRAISVSANSIYNSTSQQANNSFIVGNDGKVYGAGANYYGQLGTGNTTSSTTFVAMQVFGSNEPAKEVQSGFGTTVIYTSNGRVYAVGNNQDGQVGNGSTTNTTTPEASKYLNVGPPVYF